MPLSKDRNIIVPQEELDRQMEFCGLVHTVLETRLDGRKPLAYVHTFGCQGKGWNGIWLNWQNFVYSPLR